MQCKVAQHVEMELRGEALHSTVQSSSVQYSTVQDREVQYSIVRCSKHITRSLSHDTLTLSR